MCEKSNVARSLQNHALRGQIQMNGKRVKVFAFLISNFRLTWANNKWVANNATVRLFFFSGIRCVCSHRRLHRVTCYHQDRCLVRIEFSNELKPLVSARPLEGTCATSGAGQWKILHCALEAMIAPQSNRSVIGHRVSRRFMARRTRLIHSTGRWRAHCISGQNERKAIPTLLYGL